MGVKKLLFADCAYFCQKWDKAVSTSLLLVEKEWTYQPSPQDDWLNWSNCPYKRSFHLVLPCGFAVLKCGMGMACWQSSLNPHPTPLSLEPKDFWLSGWGFYHPVNVCYLLILKSIPWVLRGDEAGKIVWLLRLMLWITVIIPLDFFRLDAVQWQA